jgi:hypothetical protein
MINIGKKIEQDPQEIIDKSVKFFGPSGLGLDIKSQDECCAQFEGAGGFINVKVTEFEGDNESEVQIIGREFDYQIKQFIKNL